MIFHRLLGHFQTLEACFPTNSRHSLVIFKPLLHCLAYSTLRCRQPFILHPCLDPPEISHTHVPLLVSRHLLPFLDFLLLMLHIHRFLRTSHRHPPDFHYKSCHRLPRDFFRDVSSPAPPCKIPCPPFPIKHIRLIALVVLNFLLYPQLRPLSLLQLHHQHLSHMWEQQRCPQRRSCVT
jgi:hypothetical protein